MVTGDERYLTRHYQWEAASGIKLTNNESSGAYPANRDEASRTRRARRNVEANLYPLCTRGISSFFTHNCGLQLHSRGIRGAQCREIPGDRWHCVEFERSSSSRSIASPRTFQLACSESLIQAEVLRADSGCGGDLDQSDPRSPWSTFGWKGSV